MAEGSSSFAAVMARLRVGEEEAAWTVFQRYARQLIALARRQFPRPLLRRVDPEDVVQSVYRSFFDRYAKGDYELRDWGSLWSLLVVITLRKCANQLQYHRRACRAVGREVSPEVPADDSGPRWEAVDPEPTPQEAALLTETLTEVLGDLEPPERQIIELSLQGYTTREIKEQLGRAERTVRRVRERVREKLERLREQA
jgi:RNA polymerase sigma-70 factor, ECF subfamily